MSVLRAKRRRAWLGLLLASLTPPAAAPTAGLPVHWCVHDLFSTLHHPLAPAQKRAADGFIAELP
jgi:hypothetical protein